MATLAQLQSNLQDNQTLVDLKKVEIGKDEDNNAVYGFNYLNNPYENFKLIDLSEDDMVAVLEEIEVAQNEPTQNT